MTVEDDIFGGFLRTLEGGLSGLGLTAAEMAVPGVTFSEPAAQGQNAWIRPSLLTAPPTGSVSFTSKNNHVGVFQVSVFQAKGFGEMRARTIAGGIISLFKRGTVITEGTTKVHVLLPPFLLPLIPEDKWTHLPVRVQYTCFANNPA